MAGGYTTTGIGHLLACRSPRNSLPRRAQSSLSGQHLLTGWHEPGTHHVRPNFIGRGFGRGSGGFPAYWIVNFTTRLADDVFGYGYHDSLSGFLHLKPATGDAITSRTINGGGRIQWPNPIDRFQGLRWPRWPRWPDRACWSCRALRPALIPRQRRPARRAGLSCLLVDEDDGTRPRLPAGIDGAISRRNGSYGDATQQQDSGDDHNNRLDGSGQESLPSISDMDTHAPRGCGRNVG